MLKVHLIKQSIGLQLYYVLRQVLPITSTSGYLENDFKISRMHNDIQIDHHQGIKISFIGLDKLLNYRMRICQQYFVQDRLYS